MDYSASIECLAVLFSTALGDRHRVSLSDEAPLAFVSISILIILPSHVLLCTAADASSEEGS
jgi:hypothetical protein